MKGFWLKIINEEAKPQFIKRCVVFGWVVMILSLLIDLYFPTKYFWFQRSGAVLCMLSIAAEFRLNQLDRTNLIDDWNARINDEKALDSPMFIETNYEKGMKLIAHTSVGIGTFVWAYGDLLIK